MNSLVIPSLLVAGVVSAQAQVVGSTGGYPSVTIGGRMFIEGRILSGGEHSPVQSAEVRLIHRSGSELARTTTNTQGEFTFSNVSEGTYTLNVNHPNYEGAALTVQVLGAPAADIRVRLVARQSGGPSVPGPPRGVWALKVPDNARSEYQKGIKEVGQGRDERSISNFRAAIQLYPEFASAHSALAAALIRQGKTEDARAEFERALEIDGNLADACLGLGALYSAEENFERGEQLLLRARQLRPESWLVEYELGQLYWRMGEWAKAEERLRQAVAEPHEVPRLYLLLINVLALQEKYPETLAAMDDFLERFSRDKFAEQVRRKRELLQAEMKKSAAAPR